MGGYAVEWEGEMMHRGMGDRSSSRNPAQTNFGATRVVVFGFSTTG